MDMGIEIHQVYANRNRDLPASFHQKMRSHAGSTGKAFTFTEVRVVDDQGNECSPEAGVYESPHIMVGYWNRPEANAETLVDGWLPETKMDEDGFRRSLTE